MVTQLLLGGSRMIFLGILGEYVGRMHVAVTGKKPQATIRAVLNTGGALRRHSTTPDQSRPFPTWRGEPCLGSLVYRNPLLYESLMIALYGRHYPARFRAIAELIPAGSSVLDALLRARDPFSRYLKAKGVDYTGLDINVRFIAAA